jgi:hypothetical protein
MQDKVRIWLFQQGSKNDHSEPLGLNKSELLKKDPFWFKGPVEFNTFSRSA